MGKKEQLEGAAALERERVAESLLADIFKQAGWRVDRQPRHQQSKLDMFVRKAGGVVYAVELKAAVEGRADRLVPFFSQAVLQAQHGAGKNGKPLAVVAAPHISEGAAKRVLEFAEQYAPNTAVGVIDFDGLRLFRGPHLEELNAEAPRKARITSTSARISGYVFSDLNQWMLKVLLAPEVPEALLSGPRERYRNASELARSANVSVMSAFRFVQQLNDQGYISQSGTYLNLVRREDLFLRWQAAAGRTVKEVPMRFLLKGNTRAQLRELVDSDSACLALFSAAKELNFGFVEGVPPYVYVRRIQPSNFAAWKNLRQCEPGERVDVIIRQAPAPQSVFRGLVNPHGLASCDVLQVWVDVSSHPSRGREQAELIRRKILDKIFRGKQ
ncbi:MAG TPA: hypothetical protein VKB05_06520 [Pyrinomonadaceae bacterium]|nr:hypothetical protein [Pyrinomonadaceae bacterium]